MQRLIQDLLAYSRTNIMEKDHENTNLYAIVEDVRSEFSETIEEKMATIEVRAAGELNIQDFQMRQLIHNLIGNSLKFARPGHPPHIRIESEISQGCDLQHQDLLPDKRYCHIKFQDNGIGFKKEYQERIFEVFQRLHSKDDYPGSGIGLAIVKKIVDNNNGVIAATSTFNKGATFDIYIPTN
jgi:light-regulated signal transduction histidine kinase (bacteriophytochrome)